MSRNVFLFSFVINLPSIYLARSILLSVYLSIHIPVYLSRYLEDDSPLAAEEEAAATKFLENVNKWRKANNREEVRTDDMYRIDG